MIVYLAGFTLSLMGLALVENWPEKSIGRRFWVVLSLLIPCLIAGLRADTIGTDVLVYVEPMFEAAARSTSLVDYWSSNWWGSWRVISVSEYEPGFVLTVWAATKLTGSLQGVIFTIEALIIIPLYLGLRKLDAPMWICMATFLFMHFNTTLNMMRQWVAMSLLLYGYGYLRDGRNKCYLVVVVVAMMFHLTSVFGLLLFFIYRFVTSTSSFSWKRVLQVIVLGFVVFGVLLVAPNLVSILLPDYEYYLTGNYSFSINQVIQRIPLLILVLVAAKSGLARGLKQPEYAFFFVMLALDCIFSQLATITSYSHRVSLYCGTWSIYGLGLGFKRMQSQAGKLIWSLAVIAYLVFYWVFYYVLMGSGETIPYLFYFE